MIPIYIIGAGGFAKEVFWLIEDINSENTKYLFSGFIEYKPVREFMDIGSNTYQIFDEDEWLRKHTNSDLVCLAVGIGNPSTIKKVSERFSAYSFPNLIHPSFKGHLKSIKMGIGNIITSGCIFTVDITIGSFNIFNLNTTVGHDVVIGNGNVINPGCNVSGEVLIGSCNLIGTNATILQCVTIGDNIILGASSLANRDIQSGLTFVGVPAKHIKKD